MWQGAPTVTAAYYGAPLYGHSHYKKFWLKKMEAEEDNNNRELRFPLRDACPSLEIRSARAASPFRDRGNAKRICGFEDLEEDDEDKDVCVGFGGKRMRNCLNDEDTEWHRGGGSSTSSGCSSGFVKACTECKAVRTPLWRNGPYGPKTLCNACGIRYKKVAGKRPTERPRSPQTPPIHSFGGGKPQTTISKGRNDEDGKVRCARKKVKILHNSNNNMEHHPVSIAESSGRQERVKPLLRWKEFERLRRGLAEFGNTRSMSTEDEEGAVVLMALSCGVS